MKIITIEIDIGTGCITQFHYNGEAQPQYIGHDAAHKISDLIDNHEYVMQREVVHVGDRGSTIFEFTLVKTTGVS